MANNNWTGWDKAKLSPTWSFKEEKVIKGVLVTKEEKVGPNESMMYTLKLEDGTTKGIWGNTILDSRLKGIEVGEEIGIEYLGEAVSPKTGRTYNNFEVYHRVIPMTKVETEETKEEQLSLI